jgi:hypothetical protein
MAARRRSRKPARRRTPKKINALNVAQSVILGNAVTQGLFNTNMIEFVTGRIGGVNASGSMATSNQITLPELLGAGMGAKTTMKQGTFTPIVSTAGYAGIHGSSLSQVLTDNLKTNGVQMITTMVVTPIAFKVIGNLAKKPRAEFNRLSRMVGLPVSL